MTDSKARIYRSEKGRAELMGFYERMLSSWPVEYEEIMLDSKYGPTHVICAGNPALSPLVLLHGSTSNAVTWAGEVEELSKYFHIFAPDMPGEPGKSSENRLSWENDDYVLWLNSLFEMLGIEKAALAGLSLGGWAALKFAASFPEKTSALLLNSPGGLANPRLFTLIKLGMYSTQGEKGAQKTMDLLFPEGFDSLEVKEFFTLLNSHFITRTDRLPMIEDRVLRKIVCPVFMVAGEKDAFFDFKKAEKRLKKHVPGARTLLFPEGAHVQPEAFREALPFLLENA